MRFSDIPGLKEIKEKLCRTVETGKIAHAQMFASSEGCANLSMALAYASLLNCSDPQNGDSCGTCPNCKKIDKLIHPDLHLIFPVSAAKNKTGKDVVSDSFIAEWRQFVGQNPYSGPLEWSAYFGGENKQLNISREESRNVVKKLSLKAYEATYKVMIIWLPEYMHPSAANALLKLLEEPPENTVFLLVTFDPEQIISTILSRVQLLMIRDFRNEEIAGYLQSSFGISEEEALKHASSASGNLGRAVRLVNDVEDTSNATFQEWMRICFAKNYAKMVDWADDFSKMNKTEQKGMLQYGLSIIRDALLSQNKATELIHAEESDIKFANDFSRALDFNKLETLYRLLNTAFYHLERNGNPRIVFLDTSLQINAAFRK